MNHLNPILHNPQGQSLPSTRQPAAHDPRSTFNVPRSPLPSPTHSTSRTTFSFVSGDPKTSPFAAVVASSGPMAKSNPIRFSTKWWDDETGLGWWGYRWYGESRWLSRDPIGEMGFLNRFRNATSGNQLVNDLRSRLSLNEGEDNVYMFGNNDALNNVDYLGNKSCRIWSADATCSRSGGPWGYCNAICALVGPFARRQGGGDDCPPLAPCNVRSLAEWIVLGPIPFPPIIISKFWCSCSCNFTLTITIYSYVDTKIPCCE